MATGMIEREAPSISPPRLAWLDGVKAVAIIWIFFNHVAEQFFGGPNFFNPMSGWPTLADRIAQLEPVTGLGIWTIPANVVRVVGWLGDQGVSLFLVATGFVLVSAVARPVESAGVTHQWWYRLRTVLPMWWICLAAWGLVGFFTLSRVADPFTSNFLLSLFGIRVRAEDLYYGVGAWWYVGLLVQIFLVAPVLIWLARRPHAVRNLVVLGVACLVIRAVGLVVLENIDYLDAWSRGAIVVTRLPEVIFGIVLCRWLRETPETRDRLLGAPSTLVIAAVTWLIGFAASFTLLGNAVAPVLLGGSTFVLLKALLDRPRPAWLSNPRSPFLRLGRITLAVFLVHHLVVKALIPAGIPFDGTALVRIVLAAVATIVIAVVLQWLTVRVTRWAGARMQRRGTRRVLTSAAVVVLLVWTAVVAADLASRQLKPEEDNGWGERPSLQASDEFGWTLTPNLDTRLRWLGYDYQMVANNEGFPGPLPTTARTPGVRRILVTGDAFTSGEGVAPTEAWPRVLAANSGAEVLNFAVTGYGPNQEAAVLRHYVPQYKPDVVVVEMFVNDFIDASTSDADFRASIGFAQRPSDSVASVLAADNLRSVIKNRVVAGALDRVRGAGKTEGYQLGNFASLEKGAITPDMAMRVQQRLAEMAAVAAANGAQLEIAMVPASAQMCGPADLPYWPRGVDLSDKDSWDIDQPQRIAADIAGRLGIHFDDLRAALAGPCAYRPDNMHLTAAGQRQLAVAVAAALEGRR